MEIEDLSILYNLVGSRTIKVFKRDMAGPRHSEVFGS